MENEKNESIATFHGRGVIAQPLKEVATRSGKKAYATYLKIKRHSGVDDNIPIYVYEDNMLEGFKEGKYVDVIGTVKTRNIYDKDGKRHLNLYAHIINISSISDEIPEDFKEYINDCEIYGYICKQPILRKTPLGKYIADIILAVNYKHSEASNKIEASYIPTILWNNTAIECLDCEQGDKLHIKGRFQSRKYLKDGKTLTAYEISAMESSVV